MYYDKEKFKNAVLYIAEKGGDDVGKKKLAKILYFVDFTSYEKKDEAMTDLPYIKESYGPMPNPKIFYPALRKLEREGTIEILDSNRPGLHRIIPKQDPNLNVFDETERKLLMNITEKHRLDSAGDLERIAQSEPPYKMVNQGEEIPYHLAFYRNSFGEMDLDDENSNTH